MQARIAGFTLRGKAHRAGLPLNSRGVAGNWQRYFIKFNLEGTFNEGVKIAEAFGFAAVWKFTGRIENFRGFIRPYYYFAAWV